ncbi:MAG: EAL domain-containing protein [Alphaproteobacteria bacterium]
MIRLNYNISEHLDNIIDYRKSFFKELDINFKKIISNRTNATFFTISITNISLLSYLYSQGLVNSIMEQLTANIKNIFNEDLILQEIIEPGVIVVLLNCKEGEISRKAYQINNIIQFLGSDLTNEPFHLISIISSINIPTETECAKDAFKKTCYILSNVNKNNEEYFFPYASFQDKTYIMKKKFTLANCLKQAIVEKKIRFAFQPIISSKTGKVAHYESLLRLINKEGKIISAGPFIQIAEEMGFVNLIDDLALELVVEELKNNPEIHLAFNLSSLGISNDVWLKKFKNLLSDSDLASRLIVEITETAAQRDLGKSAYFIASIQDLGCQVALDDFGAGYTSFRQLKALPIDIIKIDGSFIKDIAENSNNLLFVKTLINMSKSFGFKSVAEFVENGEIAKTLIELNVDYMQGNYFCPAINYRNWHKGEI